ncbi:MAG: hypothetical protein AB2L09_10475 [Coriobacteriia bacterium]
MPANSKQRGFVVLLSIIAVMLALLIGVMIYMFAGGLGSSSGSGSAAGSSSGASAESSASAVFDPATATKVPEGMGPKEAVEQYHKYLVAKEYGKAYELLPLASKASYGSESAFTKQLAEYNVSGYELVQPQETADTYQVVAVQATSQISVAYQWTLKKVDGQWYIAQRDMLVSDTSGSGSSSGSQ